MEKTKKLALAVLAALSFSGCASTRIADLARADPDPATAPAAEQKVSRALPSYGSMGGYRYRRLAAVAAAD